MEEAKKTAKLLLQLSNSLLTSLNSGLAASDLMARRLERQPEEDGVLADHLAVLRHSQFQVLRVADNMKTLALLELGSLSPEREAVDLVQLCSDLADTVCSLVPEIPVTFSAAEGSFITACDAKLIEKLLLNLVSNSILHCESGNEIRIRLLRASDTIQIIVADNGSGIPRETMETLFSDYLRRADLSDTARGSGLGLSVAEAIARAHGGTLFLTAEPGHGTKAVFSLPHAWSSQLRGDRVVYQSRGQIRRFLTELSDVCDFHKFQPPFL